MSDKVASVIPVAPVATPGRFGSFAQGGPASPNNAVQGSSQNPALPNVDRRRDIVSLLSIAAGQLQQPDAGSASVDDHAQPQPQPQSQSQAQAQAALAAAEAAAAARAQAEQSQQQNPPALQDAANTLSSYFSNVHPDVTFRVEQQPAGMVVLMVNALSGKVLQTIPGEEARQLASSLFGSASLLPQTA